MGGRLQMKNILLLGSKGMLGKYFDKYFNQQRKFNIICSSREDLDAENVSVDDVRKIIEEKNIDYIINCVGMIKPQIAKYSLSSAIKVNSLFPHILNEAVTATKAKLIHITTDCIYTGYIDSNESYDENHLHDMEDDYGLTKFVGEPAECTVIRTSIIGEEVGQQRSLIEWVKSNKGGKIKGFSNHLWNGVTCLQLAKITHDLIINNKLWEGKRHIYSNIVDKFDLLNLINNAFKLNIEIEKTEGGQYCNRSLTSIYENLNDLDLKEQLDELVEFNSTLNDD